MDHRLGDVFGEVVDGTSFVLDQADRNDVAVARDPAPLSLEVLVRDVAAFGQYVKMRMPSVGGLVVGDFHRCRGGVNVFDPEPGAAKAFVAGVEFVELFGEWGGSVDHGQRDESGWPAFEKADQRVTD